MGADQGGQTSVHRVSLDCFIYRQVGCGDEAGLDGLGVTQQAQASSNSSSNRRAPPSMAQSISSAAIPAVIVEALRNFNSASLASLG